MAKERFETGDAVALTITCQGDLQLRGWTEPAVMVNGDELEVDQAGKALTISGSADLDITVPAAAAVTIQAVRGDLVLRNVTGPVRLDEANGDVVVQNSAAVDAGTVHGDLLVRKQSGAFAASEIMGDASLRSTLDIRLGHVHGDLAAQNVDGSAEIGECMGDVSLKTVSGDVMIRHVHRDVNLRYLGGLCQIDHVHGDARLRGDLVDGKHRVHADGDIVLRWPVGAPLHLEATGRSVGNRMSFDEYGEQDGVFHGRVGQGETHLFLDANGRIVLKDLDQAESWDDTADIDLDFGDLGVHISTVINSRMSELSKTLEQKLGPKFAARMEQRAQEAAARAEKAAERAMRKAEKAARRAQWQSRRSGYRAGSPRAEQKSRQATEEEQLKILKMVEQGIITPDEANTLLEAIEG